MKEKMKQLANYYKPYRFLFWSDMVVAVIGAGITLVIPLIVRYITNHVIHLENPLPMILKLAVLMLGLVVLEAFCNFYQAYYGHIMGAKMERDMRAEIFEHYQKLSFHFQIRSLHDLRIIVTLDQKIVCLFVSSFQKITPGFCQILKTVINAEAHFFIRCFFHPFLYFFCLSFVQITACQKRPDIRKKSFCPFLLRFPVKTLQKVLSLRSLTVDDMKLG